MLSVSVSYVRQLVNLDFYFKFLFTTKLYRVCISSSLRFDIIYVCILTNFMYAFSYFSLSYTYHLLILYLFLNILYNKIKYYTVAKVYELLRRISLFLRKIFKSLYNCYIPLLHIRHLRDNNFTSLIHIHTYILLLNKYCVYIYIYTRFGFIQAATH